VAAGCTQIIAHPFFLFAGTHTARDIPAALAAAQAEHPGTTWALTEPLGLHPGVLAAVRDRVSERLAAEHPAPSAQTSPNAWRSPADG
jgi:sirohydrochlorin ferrochelatase